MSHYYLGNYQQARLECEHGIDLASRSHLWRGLGYMHVYGGMIELARGNIDDAVEHAEKAIQLGERYKHAEIASTGYRTIADLYYWLNDPQTSLIYCRRAVDASQEQYLGVNSRFRLGFALFVCGDRDQGRSMVEEVLKSTTITGLGIVNIQARLCLMYIHRMTEEWELTHQLADQLYHEALQRSIPTVRIAASIILGGISLRKGDADQAFLYYQGAARLAAKLPHPWLEIQSLIQLDSLSKKAGCPDPLLHPRILSRLDQLSAGVYKSPYFEAFQVYQAKVIQAIS
jgi:tetratricopeptide (TPR) repeat protein